MVKTQDVLTSSTMPGKILINFVEAHFPNEILAHCNLSTPNLFETKREFLFYCIAGSFC